jgi:hypothetical protein
MTGAPYHVCLPTSEQPCVELWAGYQLQFAGMRAQSWQDDLAVELRAALHTLAPDQVGCLRGTYATTDSAACDVENRLFTNPGDAIPRRFRSILFERSPSPPPEPPAPTNRVAGQLHYYRYDLGDGWRCWEPDKLLATWNRVPRLLADDGSARPAWLAMKSAVDRGLVAATGLLGSTQDFGVRLVMHATRNGPRSAPAISEPLIDGVIAAFHAADPRLEVAAILAARLGAQMPDPSEADIERFVRTDGPGPLFTGSPFRLGGAVVHLSPDDERCVAGHVSIQQNAHGRYPEISGELFAVNPRPSKE